MMNVDIILCRHNRGQKAPQIRPSVIRYNELTIVKSGMLEYSSNGEEIIVGEGEAIFLPAGTLRVRKPSDSPCDYISFNFTSDEKIELPKKLSGCSSNKVNLLITLIDDLNERGYLDNKEKTEHLLSCLLLMLVDRHKTQNYNPLTLKIMKHLHANLSRRVTLNEIGALTFFSPVYCDAVFQKEVGNSIVSYHLELRISEAKKLLAAETLSLPQIASLVGFDDYNYFSRIFKKRTGYSPKAYRAILQRQE